MVQWRYESPVGPLTLEVSEKRLHCIRLMVNEFKTPITTGVAPAVVRPFLKALDAYFAGHGPKLDPALLDWSNATPFQVKVWLELLRLDFGQIIAYSKLAIRIGLFHGARAVANAMAANPIPILVPCHRVIRSNGDLGGYSGGLDWKVKLLQHEGLKLVKTNSGCWTTLVDAPLNT